MKVTDAIDRERGAFDKNSTSDSEFPCRIRALGAYSYSGFLGDPVRNNMNAKVEDLTMNEISELLQQRFGLSADQAQEAERAILDLVKSKVPPQFQGVLDSLLGQSQAQGDGIATASTESGGLGGFLGAAEGLLGAHNG